jgi:superfamily I DNA/RNA helicase
MRHKPDHDLLADLTPAQREAVIHFEGPLLILAGAGSGKTRVITRRVAYLIQQGVRPSNILAITFTNKAAGEMRQRVEALLPDSRVWISTFHSLGARLLRQYGDRFGLDRNFTIYDQTDRNKLVKSALEASGIDNVRFTPERIEGAISKAKNQLLTPEKYAQQASDFFGQTVAQIYPLYEKRLRDANALDFDDLLLWPALALKNDLELRAELDARFRFVLIDEYQDTNKAQYAIARGLSVDQPNLCVVGDPDQCLPPGTMIQTPSGPRAIETMHDGDRVLAGIGWGKTGVQTIDKVMVNPFRGWLQKIRVSGGIEVLATHNHVCFARLERERARDQRLIAAKGDTARAAARFYGWHYEDPRDRSFNSPFGDLCDFGELPKMRFLRGKPFTFVAAANLFEGLFVPVFENGRIVERTIEAIESEWYEGPVYDLSVPEVHNFIANNLVVHNSIYKWRGSDIRNILDFERDFPSARVITLDRNYRSTKSILRAASHLIAHNRQRKPKDLFTDNPQGQPVQVLTFETGVDEADGIARRIRADVEAKKHHYRDFAVFVRMNALTRTLEQAFAKQGVKCQIVRGLAFFDRKENRDVLAYLRLLLNPRDDVSFLRVVNEPARGIGKISLDHLRSYAEPREMSLLAAAGEVAKIPAIKGKAVAGLRDFAVMMRELSQFTDAAPNEVIRQVLDRSGYRLMLKSSSDSEDQERLANIEELITAAKQFVAEDSSRTIGDFLENITLASDVDGWDEKQDSVSVMTMHAAKGLEFPVVYLLAVEQGILPHERSLSSQKDEEVEEERRLAFVGMTRAKEELHVCHARLREFRGQTLYAVPSMFLDELPADAIEALDLSASAAGSHRAMTAWRGGGKAAEEGWKDAGIVLKPKSKPGKGEASSGEDTSGYVEGMMVRHDTHGIGRVTEVSGYGAMRKVKVRFSAGGERTFMVNNVKLTVVRRS